MVLGEDESWLVFLANRDERRRQELVEAYIPLVETVLRTFRNVRAADREDLRGAGYFGLVRAVDEWQPGKMRWLDFARIKIRYAMVNQIREVSWVPKAVRNVAKRVEGAEAELTQELGREPTLTETAARLGVSVEKTEQMVASFRATDWSVVSFEGRVVEDVPWRECLPDPDAPDPEDRTLWAEQVDALELVLQRLSGPDRQLIEWKYFVYPPVNQKWMAERLGVHESRISQLLDAALERARRFAEHPVTLFPEIYEDSPRITRRD